MEITSDLFYYVEHRDNPDLFFIGNVPQNMKLMDIKQIMLQIDASIDRLFAVPDKPVIQKDLYTRSKCEWIPVYIQPVQPIDYRLYGQELAKNRILYRCFKSNEKSLLRLSLWISLSYKIDLDEVINSVLTEFYILMLPALQSGEIIAFNKIKTTLTKLVIKNCTSMSCLNGYHSAFTYTINVLNAIKHKEEFLKIGHLSEMEIKNLHSSLSSVSISDISTCNEYVKMMDNPVNYRIPALNNSYDIEEICDEIELCEILDLLLDTLSPRERIVIEKRFGLFGELQQYLETVARSYNVDRQRIREIEAKALQKLQHPARRKMLDSFHVK